MEPEFKANLSYIVKKERGNRRGRKGKKSPVEETFPIRTGVYESYAILVHEWLPEQVLMIGLSLGRALAPSAQ